MSQQKVYFTAIEIVASAQRMHEAQADWQRHQEWQHQMALLGAHLDSEGDITQVISALGAIAATAIRAYAPRLPNIRVRC